jgi:hypothetical protein
MSAIQAEQARNPRRSTWDVLLALEAAEKLAAGEFAETVAILPLRETAPEDRIEASGPDEEAPRKVAVGGR